MKIFPAKMLLACTAGLAAASSLLVVRHDLLPWVLGGWAALLAPVLWDLVWLKKHAHNVSAGLFVPPSCIRGTAIPAMLRVGNEGPAAMNLRVRPVLAEQGNPNVWDRPLVLTPGAFEEILLPIEAPERGTYEFGDIYVRVAAPLKVLQAQRRIPADHTCKVYPDVNRVKDYLVSRRSHSVAAPHLRTARIRGIGSEFESLRNYEEGDDVRRIDWKATAKHGALITRNYEIESFRNVLMLIDRGRLMAGKVGSATKLDLAVDAALMVAGVVLDSGDRCGLLVFDQEVSAFLGPRGGMGHFRTVVETLYDVKPTTVESHFRRAFVYLQNRLAKRSLIIVLSDVLDTAASAALIQGLLALGSRHLVVIAALRTPAVEDVIRTPVERDQDPFRKAVAYRLMKERSEAMGQLQKGGVHVLDVRPEQLTMPLINKYIELRERNLL